MLLVSHNLKGLLHRNLYYMRNLICSLGDSMGKTIGIYMNDRTLQAIDALVEAGKFKSRSAAIQAFVQYGLIHKKLSFEVEVAP